MTEWRAIASDNAKLRSRVAEGSVGVGYALLLDEGGYFRRREASPPFGAWQVWGRDRGQKMAPALLLDRIA